MRQTNLFIVTVRMCAAHMPNVNLYVKLRVKINETSVKLDEKSMKLH